jgi:hypothetical protein
MLPHRSQELSGYWEARCRSDYRVNSAVRAQRGTTSILRSDRLFVVKVQPIADVTRVEYGEAVEAATPLRCADFFCVIVTVLVCLDKLVNGRSGSAHSS